MGNLLRREKEQNGINMSNFNVTIERLDSTMEGTFGRLTFNNFVCFTGELPWKDNQSNISCIPKGMYFCHWTYSERFKRMMYLVDNVPNRGGIRIHPANLMGDDSQGFKRQLNGCIALGQTLGMIDRQKALLLSRPVVRQFEDLMKGREFTLEIR